MEGDSVNEVDSQEQGEPEDHHEDRGGPPVRAEPAFPIVQDSTNLREVAPMRERLYRHCRNSRRARSSRKDAATRGFWNGPRTHRRDGLKLDAHVPARDEATRHGDAVLPRVERGPGTPGRCRERRDPRGLALL